MRSLLVAGLLLGGQALADRARPTMYQQLELATSVLRGVGNLEKGEIVLRPVTVLVGVATKFPRNLPQEDMYLRGRPGPAFPLGQEVLVIAGTQPGDFAVYARATPEFRHVELGLKLLDEARSQKDVGFSVRPANAEDARWLVSELYGHATVREGSRLKFLSELFATAQPGWENEIFPLPQPLLLPEAGPAMVAYFERKPEQFRSSWPWEAFREVKDAHALPSLFKLLERARIEHESGRVSGILNVIAGLDPAVHACAVKAMLAEDFYPAAAPGMNTAELTNRKDLLGQSKEEQVRCGDRLAAFMGPIDAKAAKELMAAFARADGYGRKATLFKLGARATPGVELGRFLLDTAKREKNPVRLFALDAMVRLRTHGAIDAPQLEELFTLLLGEVKKPYSSDLDPHFAMIGRLVLVKPVFLETLSAQLEEKTGGVELAVRRLEFAKIEPAAVSALVTRVIGLMLAQAPGSIGFNARAALLRDIDAQTGLARGELRALLASEKVSEKAAALGLLAHFPKIAVPLLGDLEKLLSSAAPELRRGALSTLGTVIVLEQDYERADRLVPQLVSLLADPVRDVREQSAAALGRFTYGAGKHPALARVWSALAAALEAHATDPMTDEWTPSDAIVKAFIAGDLQHLPPEILPRVKTVVEAMLAADSDVAHQKALYCLGVFDWSTLDAPQARSLGEKLTPYLTHPKGTVRANAVYAVAMLGPQAASLEPRIATLLSDKDPGVRANAAQTIVRIQPDVQAAAKRVMPLCDDPSAEVRSHCADALLRLDLSKADPALKRAIAAARAKGER